MRLIFFAIPSADIDNVLSVRYTVSGVGTIRASWNRITDKIVKLETYRVKDFVTLAKLTEAPKKDVQPIPEMDIFKYKLLLMVEQKRNNNMPSHYEKYLIERIQKLEATA